MIDDEFSHIDGLPGLVFWREVKFYTGFHQGDFTMFHVGVSGENSW